MTKLICTTGQSNTDKGTTELRIGAIRKDGMFVIRELHNSGLAKSDKVSGRMSSSTQGAKASSVLGDWVTREIDFEEDAVIVLQYGIKSTAMPIKKSMTFMFRVSDAYPLVQLVFPVVTNLHSTIVELPVTGRLRLMTHEEIGEEVAKRVDIDLAPLSMIAARKTLESLGAEDMEAHWTRCANPRTAEGTNFLAIATESRMQSFNITIKWLLDKKITKQQKASGKKIATPTGSKTIISSRRRRIKL